MKPRIVIASLCAALAVSADAATFTVSNNADSGAGSLRQALADANGAAGADTIVFDAGLNGQTIVLTSGELVISDAVTIQGPADRSVTVSGNDASRVFRITTGSFDVTLSGIRMVDGFLAGTDAEGGGGIRNSSNGTLTLSNCELSQNAVVSPASEFAIGGGIANYGTGTLALVNTLLTQNSATQSGTSVARGGGIYMGVGAITVSNSTISQNSAVGSASQSGAGGGIYVNSGAPITLTAGSVLADNFATGRESYGGGIYSESGTIAVVGSTVSGNYGTSTSGGRTWGGGIFTTRPINISANSIISGNSARGPGEVNGGGIYTFSAAVTMTDSTMSGNYAGTSGSSATAEGGGIYVRQGATGAMAITNSTLSGNSSAVRGGAIFSAAGSISITGSTLSGNFTRSAGGAIFSVIIPVTVSNSTFSGNHATNPNSGTSGGAIQFEGGTSTVTNCTFSGNYSESPSGGEAQGGAIGITRSGVNVTMTGVNFTENRATALENASGGVIYINSGTATVRNSAMTGNFASVVYGDVYGGAINQNGGTLNIVNSTIGRNTLTPGLADPSQGIPAGKGQGGAILFNGGTLRVDNSTIAENSASRAEADRPGVGGGISNTGLFGGTVTVKNTIIALNKANTDGPDVFGEFVSGGYNIIGDATDSTGFVNGVNGDQVGVNPMLQPLANYGGATLTYAITAGSPALDAGDPNFSSAAFTPALTTDQRGFPRVRHGRLDIGAYEAPPPLVITIPENGSRTGATPTITGTAEPGSTVVLNITDGTSTKTVTTTADSNGNFSVNAPALTEGSWSVSGAQGFSAQEIALAPFPSNTRTFTVDATPPVISGTPSNITTEATGPGGATVTYTPPTATDSVDGARPVTCAPASGSTFAVGTTMVTCSASDTVGNTATATFNVTVQDTTAPVITVPADIVVYNEEGKNGATVAFEVSATDIVSGAITPSANPPSGSVFPIGTTVVTVTAQDAAGNTSTKTFEVTVRKTELANIATRVPVGTGEKVGIGGFIIRGTDSLRVIVRARGPSMRSNGQAVPGAMENPMLDLFDSSGNPAPFASNDNWQDSPDRDEIAASGLAPEDPREAAIIAVLPAGAYTGIVSGADGSTGNALIEVFALPGESNSSLVNISTRGPVLTADDLLIGGVIVRGGTPQRLVFRAIGPSLANRGVAEALSNPRLELRDTNGDLIISNDDWQQSPDAAEIQGAGLAPEDPREAAIQRSLGDGDYTAIVRGEDGATGVGMVEVYRVE